MDAGLNAQDAIPIKWPDMPYRGLNYFRESDAPLFTERDGDIRDCGTLIGQFSTRILLLHGNSGAGKSSFLRAGLVPWLKQQHGAFYFLTDDNSEPVFVRSTDDPVYQVHEVLRVALERDLRLSGLQTNEILSAKEELSRPPTKDRDQLAKRVVDALSAIALGLTPALVLMIDQSEEVFSTGTPNDEDKRRLAFFNMLEELCYQKLPLKVIVVMRTEFYGRFSNALSILPRTNVDTHDIGFRQYLLRDLQTKSSLVAVITRPTLDTPELAPNPPRSVYGFTFADEVPQMLADDLLSQFGDSCPLPVLQIVCETLYRNVVLEAKRSEITVGDYTGVGGAQGFMDKYIDTAIADVLSMNGSEHAGDAVVSWRHVLASLAGRQGSGSVATLIATEQTLVQTADAQGLSGDIRSTLSQMAERRLLRKITPVAGDHEEEARFSLGHDALAASLCIWSEAWNAYEGQRSASEKQLERWRKRMRAKVFTAAFVAAAVVATGMGFLIYNFVSAQDAILQRTTASIQQSTEPSFPNKLLGLMASLDSTASNFPIPLSRPSRQSAERQLRSVLLRSPRYGGMADGAGVDLASKKLAFLQADGTVSVQEFNGAGAVIKLGKIPDSRMVGSFPATAVGFVSGIENPVVYKNGFLNVKIGSRWVTPYDLTAHLPPEFQTGTPPFVEIAGGSIRAIVSNPKDRTFNLILLNATKKGNDVEFAIASKIAVSRSDGRYVPTISDSSNLVARLAPAGTEGAEALYVADMAIADSPWNLVAAMQPLNQQTGLNFARSVSFSPSGRFVALRREQNELKVFSLISPRPGPAPTIRMDNWPNSMPPSWPNLRPLMAAVKTGDTSWRVAWPTTSGIVAGDGDYGELLKPLAQVLAKTTDALYSNAIDAMRLKFSEDGNFLTAESRTFGGRQSVVLVWDLSTDRLNAVNGLDLKTLEAEACRVAEITGPAEISSEDMSALFGGSVKQPCPRQ